MYSINTAYIRSYFQYEHNNKSRRRKRTISLSKFEEVPGINTRLARGTDRLFRNTIKRIKGREINVKPNKQLRRKSKRRSRWWYPNMQRCCNCIVRCTRLVSALFDAFSFIFIFFVSPRPKRRSAKFISLSSDLQINKSMRNCESAFVLGDTDSRFYCVHLEVVYQRYVGFGRRIVLWKAGWV